MTTFQVHGPNAVFGMLDDLGVPAEWVDSVGNRVWAVQVQQHVEISGRDGVFGVRPGNFVVRTPHGLVIVPLAKWVYTLFVPTPEPEPVPEPVVEIEGSVTLDADGPIAWYPGPFGSVTTSAVAIAAANGEPSELVCPEPAEVESEHRTDGTPCWCDPVIETVESQPKPVVAAKTKPEEPIPARHRLEKMRLEVLRALCKKHDLSALGRRPDLIGRLRVRAQEKAAH